MSAAVRLVCFFSAAFAAMFHVAGIGHSAVVCQTTGRARQQPAARCTTVRCWFYHVGQTGWPRSPRPARRFGPARSGSAAPWRGCGVAASLGQTRSERAAGTPSGQAVRQADANPRYRALHRGSIAALSGLEGRQQHRLRETAAPLPRSAPSPSADDFHTATRGILEKIAHRHRKNSIMCSSRGLLWQDNRMCLSTYDARG